MCQDNANRHKDCSNAPGERTGDGTKGLGWVGPEQLRKLGGDGAGGRGRHHGSHLSYLKA